MLLLLVCFYSVGIYWDLNNLNVLDTPLYFFYFKILCFVIELWNWNWNCPRRIFLLNLKSLSLKIYLYCFNYFIIYYFPSFIIYFKLWMNYLLFVFVFVRSKKWISQITFYYWNLFNFCFHFRFWYFYKFKKNYLICQQWLYTKIFIFFLLNN